jgi:formate-dependent nitrite reductase membrane component NrfD
VLAYERDIPFWHSAAVPLLAFFMGVAAGSGLYGMFGKTETGKMDSPRERGSAALTYLVHLHSVDDRAGSRSRVQRPGRHVRPSGTWAA